MEIKKIKLEMSEEGPTRIKNEVF